jgi:hypothetical protein
MAKLPIPSSRGQLTLSAGVFRLENSPGKWKARLPKGALGRLCARWGSADSEMPVKSIQLGQVWRHEASGKLYLVTKLYREVLAEFAMLREANVPPGAADSTRVRVTRTPAGATLAGYIFTQDTEENF